MNIKQNPYLKKIHTECEKLMILRNVILKKQLGGNININHLKEMMISIVSMEECITDEIIIFLERLIKEVQI